MTQTEELGDFAAVPLAAKLVRRVQDAEEALRRRDALLRRWLDYAQITPGSPPDLHDDTKRELGDSHE